MNRTVKITPVSVIISTIVAFIISSAWYIVFGDIWMKLRGIDPATAANQSMPVWSILAEVGRTLVLAIVLAWFVAALNINTPVKAIRLCLIIWIGFPVMILSGSVLHENVPWKIAAIHAGDWLVKPLAIIFILSLFKKNKTPKNA